MWQQRVIKYRPTVTPCHTEAFVLQCGGDMMNDRWSSMYLYKTFSQATRMCDIRWEGIISPHAYLSILILTYRFRAGITRYMYYILNSCPHSGIRPRVFILQFIMVVTVFCRSVAKPVFSALTRFIRQPQTTNIYWFHQPVGHIINARVIRWSSNSQSPRNDQTQHSYSKSGLVVNASFVPIKRVYPIVRGKCINRLMTGPSGH